ncbi:unnamed protein product [Meganyctiphanes norvegica]|uniref:Uncharacterized protein n=1 Tax=Meganyctiphanes norvegica TaxID=48144 RepID=A0AAV2PVT9_MEGNR
MARITLVGCVVALLITALADSGQDLFDAVRNGTVNPVEQLLSAGADPNTRETGHWGNFTALHEAAWGNYVNITRALIKDGADIDVKDNYWRTPLLIASWKGGTALVRVLAAAGAAVDGVDPRWTPLIAATEHGHLSTVEALVDLGADITIKDKNGDTALHWAARKNETDITQVLLRAGANPRELNNNGTTPLGIAQEMGHVVLANIIDDFSISVPTSTIIMIVGITCGATLIIVVGCYLLKRYLSARSSPPQPQISGSAQPRIEMREHIIFRNSNNVQMEHIYECAD